MGQDDDRPSWVEREKKSFSELDRMRRGERASCIDGRDDLVRPRAREEGKKMMGFSRSDHVRCVMERGVLTGLCFSTAARGGN